MRQIHNFIPSAALMATVLLGGCTDVGNGAVIVSTLEHLKHSAPSED